MVGMDHEIPEQPRKGRGAIGQPSPRFDVESRTRVDDGWQQDELPPLPTTVTVDATKSIIARNKSPDVPFDQSINPYRGCEHVTPRNRVFTDTLPKTLCNVGLYAVFYQENVVSR
jgi:hypothetical protein